MRAHVELKVLPNVLSFSRIALAAGFVIADKGGQVVILFVAAATDFFDGWLARRVNAATRWGALIDPIADRFFMLVAVSTCLFAGTLSTLGYFIMISRDLMTAIGFLVARAVSWLRPVQFKARRGGKIVTVLQLVTLLAALTRPDAVPPLLAAVAGTSAWAIGDYTFALWRARTPGVG